MAFAIALPMALSAAAISGECRDMRVARPAGAVILEGDTVAVPCLPEAISPRLRYDLRRRVAVARNALEEGDRLGRVYLPARPGVLPGEAVQLVARLGHVVVRRQMTALQPAQAHERFFARDAQGRIVVAPRLAEAVTR